MSNAHQSQRVETIQVLRAIAAILVVLIHALETEKVRKDWAHSWMGSQHALSTVGAAGVDVFFVLSGFVMAATVMRTEGLDPKRFLQDRFRRVMPFYWLMSIAFLALLGLIGGPVHTEGLANSITLFPLVNPVVFTQPVLFVGWSLAFEMAFYLAVAGMLALRLPKRLLLPALLSVTVLLAIAGAILPPSVDLLAIWFSPFWFEFAFGIAICMIWLGHAGGVPAWLGVPALLGAAAGFGHAFVFNPPAPIWLPEDIYHHGTGMLRIVWWGVPSGLLVLAMLWSCEPMARAGRFTRSRIWHGLLAIGDASFALYLVHPFVTYPTQYVLPGVRWGVDGMILAEIGLSCWLALIVHRRVEQPLLAAMRRPRPAAEELVARSA